MRQPLIAGNWKMNGSKAFVAELLLGIKTANQDIQTTEIAVCAPFPYLYLLEELLAGTPIRYGAQDVAFENDGAFTGQVSVKMLKDFGCHYAIIGHSERRQFNAETDAIIARKYAQAIANDVTPILCIGESLAERQQAQTEAVVARQLDAVIELNGIDALAKGVVAYEPVWAIGTGMTATPEQAQAVHAFLRARIAAHDQTIASQIRILYGGSMKSNNALELIMQPDIDGGLIGGASLKADEFLAICQAGDAAIKATAV